MTKQDVIDKMAEVMGTSKPIAAAGFECVLDSIRQALLETGSCGFVNFGTFSAKATEARTGRNPATGEPLAIAAGIRVSFKPAPQLRAMLAPKLKAQAVATTLPRRRRAA